MTRRAVLLCCLFAATSQLSTGCWYWRPFLWRGHCFPRCCAPVSAGPVMAGPMYGDPGGAACYSSPAMQPLPVTGPMYHPPGQPVFTGPSVPLGPPQVYPVPGPGTGATNPMTPMGTPKN